MNRFYENWIQLAQDRANQADLRWSPRFDPLTGKINKDDRWGLKGLIKQGGTEVWHAHFQHVDVDRAALADLPHPQAADLVDQSIMSEGWRSFMQAAIVHELLVRRNKVSNTTAVVRAIRTLSLCAGDTPPWEMSSDEVQLAYNVALRTGESGKLAMNVVMVVKKLLDGEHLADRAPLARSAVPYSDEISRSAEKKVGEQRRRENSSWNIHAIRSELNSRKSAERLPERRAFWELVRIVFTEEPQSFQDLIRFGALKMQILCGFRIGEAANIPFECLKWSDHFDVDGELAGKKGGVSRSLAIRYFSEKQDNDHATNGHVRLVEELQQVPKIFEDIIVNIIAEISDATAVMRARLKSQTENRRLFPEFKRTDLMGSVDAYTRISGSIRTSNEPIPIHLIEEYRKGYSSDSLKLIRDHQRLFARNIVRLVYSYWRSKDGKPPLRDHLGFEIDGNIDFKNAYFNVGEIEDFVTDSMPTKLPDTTPLIGSNGAVFFPYEFLFLHASRALIEGRNGGVVDIERYFSVGHLQASDLMSQLSNRKSGLFARYGQTAEDRAHTMESHSNRHLQNTELFRLGIADTVITKRFGRRTTAQSSSYDHRSLSESLDAVDLPPSAQQIVPVRAHDTLRMIMAGKVRGPLVDEFHSIQKQVGDDAAFAYLAAEADGFHVTPYGFCLSSFTVDPCPKHLQCFNGCVHLARTDDPKERHALEKIQHRTEVALEAAKTSPGKTIGRKNQIQHATVVLENIKVAINTAPGSIVFPQGQDLSQNIGEPKTIIDASLKQPRLL